MKYLMSQKTEGKVEQVAMELHWQGNNFPLTLSFGPYQSIAVHVKKIHNNNNGDATFKVDVENINSNFIPPPPKLDEKIDDGDPWKIKYVA
jgi:hypothetical protein